MGRTHLQDAVPVTLGQEFEAYGSALMGAQMRIHSAEFELQVLGIGGTAIGSGINSHPKFAGKMVKELAKLSGLENLSEADNKFETTHSMAAFLCASSALRSLAVELIRICNDLRLMASGPDAGFNEIRLPEVEPGSSIMPGKVNPSVLESMLMICTQVIGLDSAICLASQKGEFELNWYTPLIACDLLHQIEILTNGMTILRVDCIDGLAANVKEMRSVLEHSTAMATLWCPSLATIRLPRWLRRRKNQSELFNRDRFTEGVYNSGVSGDFQGNGVAAGFGVGVDAGFAVKTHFPIAKIPFVSVHGSLGTAGIYRDKERRIPAVRVYRESGGECNRTDHLLNGIGVFFTIGGDDGECYRESSHIGVFVGNGRAARVGASITKVIFVGSDVPFFIGRA